MAAPLAGGAVHPFGVEDAAPQAQPEGGMNGLPVLAGTGYSLALRCSQILATGAALYVLVSDDEFLTVRPFRYLYVAIMVQLVLSTGAAIADLYALCVVCSLQNIPFLLALVLGDLLSVLLYSAAWTSAGVIIYIDSDLDLCAKHSCARFKTTIAASFFSCFLLAWSLFLNFWALVSRLIAGFLHPH